MAKIKLVKKIDSKGRVQLPTRQFKLVGIDVVDKKVAIIVDDNNKITLEVQ
jgi:bifunctional DNA-binding transcriptional regulator/antitoxin component of YhaV-PrlF toxin-antitoxin module